MYIQELFLFVIITSLLSVCCTDYLIFSLYQILIFNFLYHALNILNTLLGKEL